MPKVPKLVSSVLYKLGSQEILRELSRVNQERFSDLARLDVFKTTATLAHRLRELERAGYIVKSVHNEPGKPVSIFYEITERGKKALNLLKDLESL